MRGEQGDVAALSRDRDFEAVVLPHLDAAHNLARWLMRDATAAEDVLQDAMLRALTYFPSFRGTNARGWLLQIVRNRAYTALQPQPERKMVAIAAEAEPGAVAEDTLVSADPDPETVLIRRRERLRAQDLIAALPVELRETLVLRELEELSYKEIAEITRAPIGTVMSRLWRARRMLFEAAGRESPA
jgi:RNA polymerase sigma factor (sigma-70 family)